MSPRTRDVDERSSEERSWLATDLEGRTVGFWIVVAVTIAVVVVGVGAWWVWGLGRGMPMGDADYSPLRTVVLVTWHDEDQARELTSAADVQDAADAGEVELEETDVVVNMPVLTWPEGAR